VLPPPKITHAGISGQTGTGISGTSKAFFKFTSTSGKNNITFANDTVCRILVVAGGGGGGSRNAGGGGAGALIHSMTVTLSAGVQYAVVIGAGGAGTKFVYSSSNMHSMMSSSITPMK
jgi:hypothetical protein